MKDEIIEFMKVGKAYFGLDRHELSLGIRMSTQTCRHEPEQIHVRMDTFYVSEDLFTFMYTEMEMDGSPMSRNLQYFDNVDDLLAEVESYESNLLVCLGLEGS